MRKLDLNAIYISERVQETLRLVSVSALTAVVAPMGYGKTTAINWFLNQRKQTENAVILRVNIYLTITPSSGKAYRMPLQQRG